MEHLPAIITALVALLTALGGAGRFVWLRIEKRFVAIEAELAECKARELVSHERRAKHLIVIELLWREVERLSRKGDNEVLTRAKHLLDELKLIGEPKD